MSFNLLHKNNAFECVIWLISAVQFRMFVLHDDQDFRSKMNGKYSVDMVQVLLLDVSTNDLLNAMINTTLVKYAVDCQAVSAKVVSRTRTYITITNVVFHTFTLQPNGCGWTTIIFKVQVTSKVIHEFLLRWFAPWLFYALFLALNQ